MRKGRIAKIVGAIALAGALVVGPAIGASAATSISGGAVSCGKNTILGSNAIKRINHSHDGVITGASWNNTTYQARQSSGPASIPGWKAFTTGVGGNVQAAGVRCAN